MGWKISAVKMVNSWGRDSVLGVDLLSADLGSKLSVINVYGPYLNRAPFWDALFQDPLLRGDSVVVGGDLNFTLGRTEIWGPHAIADPQAGFFLHRLVENNLLDIEPIKLKPTWRNNRGGEARVAKRLDRFLVAEQLVDRFFMVRQWVGSGGNSDHFPIFLEIKKGPTNPPSPLKFNKNWLHDESFKNLVLAHWRIYDETLDRSAAFQFAENIKRLKGEVKEWAKAKRVREEAELK